jgi:hypothetical protein
MVALLFGLCRTFREELIFFLLRTLLHISSMLYSVCGMEELPRRGKGLLSYFFLHLFHLEQINGVNFVFMIRF